MGEIEKIMKDCLKNDFNIETVREEFEKSYNRKNINLMQKIRLKSWLYHSESRNKNGNVPFYFDNYIKVMNKQGFLDYIRLGIINCEDIGGKEKAIAAVENWYC